jgi:coenzyme PQQ synthesis protein D (PqqD)
LREPAPGLADIGRSSVAPGAAVTESAEVLPTRNPKIIFKALTAGAVLYSPQEEVYFGLNPVGVRVWELLPPAHHHLDDLCRVLSSEYPDAPAEVIRADVAEMLEELAKLGLVIPSEMAAPRRS